MAPSTPVLSIVVISYNTRQMTLECLASVYAQTKTPFELVVIDNASSDGSAEAIAHEFPHVKLIAETINHGFGPAHEIAQRYVSAEWFLLINPDTLVLNGAIDTLLAFAKRTPKAGIWGGRTLFANGSLNPMSCFGRMTLWSTFCRVLGLNGIFRSSAIFNSEYMGTWPRDTERQVDIVSGCFFLLRRETWDELDGFEQVFAMYGEEVDLCLRAHKLGYRPRITPDAEIIHYAGASETVQADKMVRLMRAKIELIKRHFSPVTRGLGIFLFTFWPLSRRIAMGIAGKLFNKTSLKAKAETWATVWARRDEWKNGL